MPFLPLFFTFALLWCATASAQIQPQLSAETAFTWIESKPVIQAANVRGAFLAQPRGFLLRAGGERWDGTAWVVSDAIELFAPDPQGEWSVAARERLPEPRMDGAAVALSDREILLVGGTGPDGTACKTILQISLTAGPAPAITVRVRGELPAPRAGAGVAVFGNSLVVAGGSAAPEGAARPEAWSVRFDELHPDRPAAWRALPSLPSGGRIRPQLAVQSDGTTMSLFLFGGNRPDASLPPLKLSPSAKAWQILDSPPEGSGTPTQAAAIGPAHLFVWTLDETTQTPGCFAFHPITERWVRHDAPPGAVRAAYVQARTLELACIASDGNLRVVHGAPAASPRRLPLLDYGVMAAYFGAVLLIGFWFSRRERSLSEYYRGENQIPPWAAGLSLMATRLSAVTMIAIPAKAYATNWTYLLLPFGNFAVVWVLARYVIPFYCRLNLTSIYEYLETRFSVGIRLLGSLSFVLLEIARLGVLILVPALVVSVVVNVNLYLCIAIIGAITTISTAVGGIKAVVWADVLQAVLIYAGALICIGFVWLQLDDLPALLRTALAAGKLAWVDPSFDLTQPTLAIIVLYWLGEIKNYMANQTNAQRFLVTRDEKAAVRGVWIGAFTMVPAICLCLVLGTALFLFYSVHPERLNPFMVKPDELLPTFVVRELPAGLAGLVLTAILSASMSNSVLNSLSAVVVKDIYPRLAPGRDEQASVRFGARLIWTTGLFGTASSMLLAGFQAESLFDQLLELLGLFGGGLGGIFLLGIFTERGNTAGAWLGYAGSCVVLYFVKVHTTIHVLAYMAVGMMSCFALGYLASRLWPRPDKNLAGLTVHT